MQAGGGGRHSQVADDVGRPGCRFAEGQAQRSPLPGGFTAGDPLGDDRRQEQVVQVAGGGDPGPAEQPQRSLHDRVRVLERTAPIGGSRHGIDPGEEPAGTGPPGLGVEAGRSRLDRVGAPPQQQGARPVRGERGVHEAAVGQPGGRVPSTDAVDAQRASQRAGRLDLGPHRSFGEVGHRFS